MPESILPQVPGDITRVGKYKQTANSVVRRLVPTSVPPTLRMHTRCGYNLDTC
jgi:hypothetical protein